MSVTKTLPPQSVVLRLPPSGDEESYQLLELPAEITKQVEAQSEPLQLTIKGRPSDDAVLCTSSSTYLLRGVTISNSLLVCRPTPSLRAKGGPSIDIRDTVHEILEVVPQPPNLDRIRTMLRPTAWRGLGHGLVGREGPGRKRKWAETRGGEPGGGGKRYTREQMRSVVQASEAELEAGLKERNVVEIDGRLQLLPAKALGPVLSIIFNLLMIHSARDAAGEDGTARAPARPIIRCLDEDHGVSPEISSAILRLFTVPSAPSSLGKAAPPGQDSLGGETDVEWIADTAGMVREVGRGLLEGIKGHVALDSFEADWRQAVGEYEDLVDLQALQGDYLLNPAPPSAFSSSADLISYFPLHNLPLAPAVRFSDLFLTRTPWRPEDMMPFLKGLYREGDTKERDKLVSKFVRVVKEKNGSVLWYPRRSS